MHRRDAKNAELILAKAAQQGIFDIVSGYNGATYVILRDGSFLVYGYNAHGQLGIGTFDYIDSPKPIWVNTPRTDRILCGISSKHSFCLTQSGNLYACGKNKEHQFGIHTSANCVSSWTRINHFSTKQKLATIACSEKYTYFLLETGQIFGTNIKPPFIKQIKTNTKFRDIKCSKLQTLAISASDDLYLWDQWKKPQKVGFFAEKEIKIKAIDCGMHHCMVLTKYDGNVYCFGHNECYQLGNGSKHSYLLHIPQLNEALKGECIVDIKCGAFHNMAMNEKKDYFFWGSNKNNECLMSVDQNTYDVRSLGHEEDFEFVKVPTRYKCDHGTSIIAVYLGYNCTKIVCKEAELKNEELVRERTEHQMSITQKFDRFKSWFGSKKSPKSDGMNRRGSDSLDTLEADDDDNKYENDDFVDRVVMKRVSGICLVRMSRKSETYEDEQYGNQRRRRKRGFSSNVDEIEYQALDVEEC